MARKCGGATRRGGARRPRGACRSLSLLPFGRRAGDKGAGGPGGAPCAAASRRKTSAQFPHPCPFFRTGEGDARLRPGLDNCRSPAFRKGRSATPRAGRGRALVERQGALRRPGRGARQRRAADGPLPQPLRRSPRRARLGRRGLGAAGGGNERPPAPFARLPRPHRRRDRPRSATEAAQTEAEARTNGG